MSDSEPEDNEKLRAVAKHVVRHVLSLSESQSTIISRAKLSTLIREVSAENNRVARFNVVYNEMNALLLDTFGYRLWGLPSKSQKNPKTKRKPGASSRDLTPETANVDLENTALPDLGDKAQFFMLVSSLSTAPRPFRELLMQEGSSLYEKRIVDESYIGDDPTLLPRDAYEVAVSTDQDLVARGLTSVVLTLVLFSRNNILHQELIQNMQKFGVSGEGQSIPVLNLTLSEFLKALVKREYLQQLEEHSSDGAQDVIFYRLGRRAQVEFDKKSLLTMCCEIMQVDAVQLPNLEKSIEMSIGDAYAS